MKTIGNILLIATLFIISSCKKESDLPDAGGDTLDKLIFAQTGSQQQILTQYNYDAQNRLAEMVNSYVDSSNYITRTSLTYNGSGKIESYTYNEFGKGDRYTTTLVYDGEGHIVKKQNTAIAPGYKVDDHTFAYDASGHIIADSVKYGQTDAIRSYYKFTYDENGNIIKSELYKDENSDLLFELYLTQNVTYNTNASPFFPMATALFLIENSWLYLSPNNPQYEDFFNLYTYYSNGLIRRLVSALPNDPNILITQDFYYK